MLRVPAPIVFAIIVATAAVTVYIYLSVIPVPVVCDGNFTSTLVAGSPYMWRGSAGFIVFESNTTIALTYRTISYVVHLNGMPTNITITDDIRIFYFKQRGYPILYVRHREASWPLLFKLVNVTKIGNITVYVPQVFDQYEVLTNSEEDAIYRYAGYITQDRVLNVYTNGTHIIMHVANAVRGDHIKQLYLKLPTPTEGTSMRLSFRGIGFSYMVGGVVYSGYAMPYTYFVITPYDNARVVIYVK